MTNEELKSRVFEMITRLRDARQKHCVLSHELRELGASLKALGGVMESDLSEIMVDVQLKDLSFVEGNSDKIVSREQLVQLFDKLKEYSENEEEIEELERCLEGAGYGNVINGRPS